MTATVAPTQARLSSLALAAGGAVHGEDVFVSGIAHDSRTVQPGDLFVAIRGAHVDATAFAEAAIRRGAAAVCSDAPVTGAPTIVVADARAALPLLAASFYGHPSRDITLIGITGSLGKTSTTLLVEAALATGGTPTGVIGSLGIRVGDDVTQTGMTTPEAPAIQGALRQMVSRGVRTAVMEVTSHSILLHRVDGLEFALGVLTNIVPYEHLEFHPTPEHYVRTKARFFGMLADGAPLVYNFDDRTAREMVRTFGRPERRRPLVGVSLRSRPTPPPVGLSADAADFLEAVVTVDRVQMDAGGSEFQLRIRAPLPRLDGGQVEPQVLSLDLPILGRQQVANAALAATSALIVGAAPDAVARALANAEPMHRRMQIVYDDGPVVLDDTVGNPESIRAVFDAVRSIPHAALRVVYAVRGTRGTDINARNAGALAEGVTSRRARLVVTASEDTAGPRDRVTPEERDAAAEALRAAGVPFDYEPALESAIARAIAGAARDDLVLLLGAQGMDAGAGIIRRLLRAGGG